MALWRRGRPLPDLVHHSDRGCQYTPIRYTDHLAEVGIAPSIGSAGDAYDNAMEKEAIYYAEIEPNEVERAAS